MKKFWLLTFFFIISSLLGIISLQIIRKRHEEELNLPLKKHLQALLPQDYLLRDFAQIPGKTGSYLIIYLEPGFQKTDWDELSCPGMILGQTLKGKYHLALYQNGKISSDMPLSQSPYNYAAGSDSDLELSYRNTKENIYHFNLLLKEASISSGQQLPFSNLDKNKIDTVKLLVFKDITGDGKAYEFIIYTTDGGCGFYDGLALGYDAIKNKPVFYSDWIPRFNPDSKGDFHYLFACGDYGNNTKIEEWYAFNKATQRFEIIRSESESCVANL